MERLDLLKQKRGFVTETALANELGVDKAMLQQVRIGRMTITKRMKITLLFRLGQDLSRDELLQMLFPDDWQSILGESKAPAE